MFSYENITMVDGKKINYVHKKFHIILNFTNVFEKKNS